MHRCVLMCAYVPRSVCMCVRVYAYAYIKLCFSVNTHLCVHLRVNIHLLFSMLLCLHIYRYVITYACVHICMWNYTCEYDWLCGYAPPLITLYVCPWQCARACVRVCTCLCVCVCVCMEETVTARERESFGIYIVVYAYLISVYLYHFKSRGTQGHRHISLMSTVKKHPDYIYTQLCTFCNVEISGMTGRRYSKFLIKQW